MAMCARTPIKDNSAVLSSWLKSSARKKIIDIIRIFKYLHQQKMANRVKLYLSINHVMKTIQNS